jgi:uncharacterized repeat protein (TIGR01451 family)
MVVVAIGSVVVAAGAALAGTETPPSASVPPTGTDFVTTVAVEQFDPSVGTLTSVTIVLAATVVGDVFVENLSTQSRGSGVATLAAEISLSLRADPAIAVAPASPMVTQAFRLEPCDTPDPATGTGCDETPDFAGPAGFTVIGLAQQATQTATFTDPADLAQFLGTGTMTFDVVANGESTGAENNGNVFFQFLTNAAADVTVTYQFEAPAIEIEKATNGEDADTPTGPQIFVGDPVDWTYVVTNTGNVDLTNITVTDDQGVAVTCPQDALTVGASMTCTATGVATLGQYANTGTVTGTAPDDSVVTDADPSHYIGAPRGDVQQLPAIEIVKSPATQTLVLGSGDDTANFTISVTNTGLVELINVAVTDALAPRCDATIGDLAVGEVSTYTCSLGGVTEGFTNVAVVSGEDAAGNTVTDADEAIVRIELPVTGSATGRQAVLGAVALALGGALLVASRQRRTHG